MGNIFPQENCYQTLNIIRIEGLRKYLIMNNFDKFMFLEEPLINVFENSFLFFKTQKQKNTLGNQKLFSIYFKELFLIIHLFFFITVLKNNYTIKIKHENHF